MAPKAPKIPVVTVALALAVAFLAAGSPARASEEAVPEAVRMGIESALKKKVASLVEKKDADGLVFQRGAYSQTFRRVDDSTYTATFHTDTIEPMPDGPGQRLKTERFLLTLKKGTGRDWEIAKEELQDTYTGQFRTDIGGKDGFYSFSKLAFAREGMKISASNGHLFTYRVGKDIRGFRIVADDLAYEYAPPPVHGYYELKLARLLRDRPQDIQFKPEYFYFYCDPRSCETFRDEVFTGLAAVDAPPGGSRFAKVYDDEVKEDQKNRKSNPFGGFGRPVEEDRIWWIAGFRRQGGEEHYASLRFDSFDAKEVAFNASGYFLPLFLYYSEALRASGASAYELEMRDDAEARYYELKGIRGSVDIALQDATELVGDVTYTIRLKRDVRELPFYISRIRRSDDEVKNAKNPKMFINSIQDGKGNELTWTKLGGFGGIVVFPETRPAGSEVTIRMQFRNLDSIYALNPTYSAMDRGGWLPFVRFADMIDNFDLTVRSPARFDVLGIGKKISDTVSGSIRTTRWSSNHPVSFPTIIFGEYIVDGTDHQEKPHHVAKKLDGTPIPVNVYVDKTSTQTLDTHITSRNAAEAFAEAASSGARGIRPKQLSAISVQASVALDIYKEVYGVDYPFDKLDLVADPLGNFYGQAPASIIYLGFGVFRGEGAVAGGDLFAGGSGISKFNKDVVAHEVGHQWWGSSTVNANDGNYWFVETLAEVSSALYVERVYGKQRYLDKVADWRRNILDTEQYSTVQDSYTQWGGESPFGSAQSNIYNKGPYAFHILRETFGDEKFFTYLKKLAQTLKQQEIVTRDIQRVTEEVYGGNMEWFFDQWIRGIGIPQYAISWTKRKTEDGQWLVDATIKQRVVAGLDKKEMPGVFYRAVAPITFVAYGGKQFKSPRPVLVEGPETKLPPMKVPVEPIEVHFNKEGEILAHDILQNRSW